MRKEIWILISVIVLSLLVTACGGNEPTAEPTAPPQPVKVEPTKAAPAETEEEVEQEPAEGEQPAQQEPTGDDPASIIKSAMAGVETDVKLFLEGIPVPDDAIIQSASDDKVEFLTSVDVSGSVEYFKQTYTALGLIEIEQLTETTEKFGTMYFGGYPDGRVIKIKFRRITPTSTEVKVLFEDI
jgi:hypothetical protein